MSEVFGTEHSSKQNFPSFQIVVGVVFNPALSKMYTAKKGRGSFCNDKKLNVSKTEGWFSLFLILFNLITSNLLTYS